MIGIINPNIFEQIKQSKQNKKNQYIYVVNDSIEVKQNLDDISQEFSEFNFDTCKNDSINNKNSQRRETKFAYDESNNLLLNFKDIQVLRKKFICFCSKQKTKEKIEKDQKLTSKNHNYKKKQDDCFHFNKCEGFLYSKKIQNISNRNSEFSKKFGTNHLSKLDSYQKNSNKNIHQMILIKGNENSNIPKYYSNNRYENFFHTSEDDRYLREYKNKTENSLYSSQEKSNLPFFSQKTETIKKTEFGDLDRLLNQNNYPHNLVRRRNSNSHNHLIEIHEKEIKNLEKIEKIIRQKNNNLIITTNKSNQNDKAILRSQKIEIGKNYKKFKDEFKAIRENDKVISQLVNKYLTIGPDSNKSLYDSHDNFIETENLFNCQTEFNNNQNSEISFKEWEKNQVPQKRKTIQDIGMICKTEKNKTFNNNDETITIICQKIPKNRSSLFKERLLNIT